MFKPNPFCASKLQLYLFLLLFCTQILQLEKRLQDQFDVRHALEKALGYRSSILHNTNEIAMPKVAPFCLHIQIFFL